MTNAEKLEALNLAAEFCNYLAARSGSLNTTAFRDTWDAAYAAYLKARVLCPACEPDNPPIPPA